MKNIIFLCGFMGCGKTTSGKLVAERLKLPFLDLDEYIEKTCKKTIPEIFASKGENYFRAIETAAIGVVSEILSIKGGVVALGGGAIANPDNAELVNENGVSVFIDVDFDTCYKRIKDDDNRPLANARPRKELEKLYNDRRKVYLEHARFTVDGNAGSETSAERIVTIHDNL